jgi:hypothetical protein
MCNGKLLIVYEKCVGGLIVAPRKRHGLVESTIGLFPSLQMEFDIVTEVLSRMQDNDTRFVHSDSSMTIGRKRVNG